MSELHQNFITKQKIVTLFTLIATLSFILHVSIEQKPQNHDSIEKNPQIHDNDSDSKMKSKTQFFDYDTLNTDQKRFLVNTSLEMMEFKDHFDWNKIRADYNRMVDTNSITVKNIEGNSVNEMILHQESLSEGRMLQRRLPNHTMKKKQKKRYQTRHQKSSKSSGKKGKIGKHSKSSKSSKGSKSSDSRSGKRPTPPPRIRDPIMDYVYGPPCRGKGVSGLPCAPPELPQICNKDDRRHGSFSHCLSACAPSFCCIHDAKRNRPAPSCSYDENCAAYAWCYIVWWKLHDTIGPAIYIDVEQNDDFYDMLTVQLAGNHTGDMFWNQLLLHHFDDWNAIEEYEKIKHGQVNAENIFNNRDYWYDGRPNNDKDTLVIYPDQPAGKQMP